MPRQSKYSGSRKKHEWVAPVTANQEAYSDSLKRKKITICIGPAGTGKTLLALQQGLKELSMGQIDKIYYVRNNCGMQDLGSKGRGDLPGGVLEKAMPLLGPIVDNLVDLVPGKGDREELIANGKIEPLYYEDLRGRSFKHAFIIADEAQNVPPKGIYTLLTRRDKTSKMVLIGDCRQKDLNEQYKDGLMDAYRRLAYLSFVGLAKMEIEDVLRDEDNKEIMKRYGEL